MALAFVCFSFFFLNFFLATCARLSWSHSAFESMLNSSVVSYHLSCQNIHTLEVIRSCESAAVISYSLWSSGVVHSRQTFPPRSRRHFARLRWKRGSRRRSSQFSCFWRRCLVVWCWMSRFSRCYNSSVEASITQCLIQILHQIVLRILSESQEQPFSCCRFGWLLLVT